MRFLRIRRNGRVRVGEVAEYATPEPEVAHVRQRRKRPTFEAKAILPTVCDTILQSNWELIKDLQVGQ